MKRFFLLIIFASICFISNAQNNREDLSVNSYWTYNGDMTNALYQHISSHAFDQITKRWSYVGGLKTKSDWEKRQAEAKKILAEIVGDFPEKTPLNPKITGTVKKTGFTVEKLYFESRPGYYVTAVLYLPAKKGKLPAILYCCGHTVDGFKGYQNPVQNLVKKGFVVLAIDPVGQGERIQYFDSQGKKIFHPDFEHSYPGTQSFVAGLPPANYFIWDGIRAIDYLLSRKEVDPSRIGITGRSGGGTQTAFIAAVDERILAAAPECYITSYDKLFRSQAPQDAEQNLFYSLKKGFDMSDLIEVRAPKPTLMVTTTRDIFSIQGSRDVFKEAKNIFTAFGEPDNLGMAEDDAEHANTPKNKVALHAFFQKFLNNPGDPKVEEIESLTEQELTVTPTGQVITSLKTVETLYSLNVKRSDELLKKLQTEKQNNPDFYKELPQKAKTLTGYSDPAPSKDYIFSGRLWRGDCAIEKYLIKGPGSYYIPVLRLLTDKNNGKCILLLDDQGKASSAAKDGLAEKLALAGYQVILPDLNGVGELSGGFKLGDAIIQDVPLNVWYAGILTHKSPLAIRTEEIKILVDFVKELGLSGAITGVACGTLSSDLLHATLINKEFGQIALINPLYSYQSIVKEREYLTKFVMSTPAGVIGKYDIPDIITALAPLKICIVNPVNALDKKVDESVFGQLYEDAGKKYGVSPNLKVSFNAQDVFLILKQWI